MKHIILFLFVLLALISCVKEEEDSPLLSAPVITLKEESSIYKTKIGREITIAPIYENTDSETTFNWTIDGKSICTTSTLTFSADEAGRYFILISATNAGGTTEKEIHKIPISEHRTRLHRQNAPSFSDHRKIAGCRFCGCRNPNSLEADSPAYRIFVAWFSSYGFIEQFLNVRKGYRHFENTK